MNTPLMPGSPSRATLQSTTGRIAAVATALLLVLFLVLSVSRAAFVASTDNVGNTADTEGLVTLSDNDDGEAMFEATEGELLPMALGLLPAQVTAALEASARCIHVRYDGDFASDPIRMFVTPVNANLGDLAPYLDVTVRMQQILPDAPLVQDGDHTCALFNAADLADVAGDPAEIFTGKLSEFGADYDLGAPTFAGEQSTYAFKITVNVENNPVAAQKSAAWNFVWEAQTTDA